MSKQKSDNTHDYENSKECALIASTAIEEKESLKAINNKVDMLTEKINEYISNQVSLANILNELVISMKETANTLKNSASTMKEAANVMKESASALNDFVDYQKRLGDYFLGLLGGGRRRLYQNNNLT